MNTLNTHVDDYLGLRRALGFKLEREGQWLADLAAYVDAAGASTLTSELAIAWASQRAGAVGIPSNRGDFHYEEM